MMSKRHYSFIFFLLICCQSCSGLQTSVDQLPRSSTLKAVCQKNDVLWRWDSVTQSVLLRDRENKAVLLIGSRLAFIGNKKRLLSSPLKRINNELFVPADFKEQVIEPLKKSRKIPFYLHGFKKGAVGKKHRRIIIDPGHGGKDPGAIGITGLYEKEVVLDIAKKLKRNLEENNIEVILTRSTDEFISLKRRTEIISTNKADLFVSLHANSSNQITGEGFEIYYAENLDSGGKYERQLQRNRWIFLRQLKVDGSSQELKDILLDLLYTHKQIKSPKLAKYVTSQVSQGMGIKDRGIKEASFFVLKNSVMPAILVEVGFLSNFKEEKMLKDPLYRTKIAYVLAKSIFTYENEIK